MIVEPGVQDWTLKRLNGQKVLLSINKKNKLASNAQIGKRYMSLMNNWPNGRGFCPCLGAINMYFTITLSIKGKLFNYSSDSEVP